MIQFKCRKQTTSIYCKLHTSQANPSRLGTYKNLRKKEPISSIVPNSMYSKKNNNR